jgi:D-alanine-D-alanine ligase
MTRRVAVIGGGRNCEHDVSLASAAGVADALDPRSCDVLRLTIGRDGRWSQGERLLGVSAAASLVAALALLADCDVVFPAVHGPTGEDGTLAALCELAGLAFVGSGVRAGAIAMDKWATKAVARDLGLATAPAVLVTAGISPPWSRPVVVKPVAAGSSHGVTLVEHPEDLAAAVESALWLDDRLLVEDLVIGREVDVAVLEHPSGLREVGPPLEIVGTGLFDTAAKYDGSARLVVPAALDPDVVRELSAAAFRLFESLGCSGVARFDFFVTGDGIVLNEINTMPGMTPHSQVPRMFTAVGLTYPALVATLVAGAHHRTTGATPGRPSLHSARGDRLRQSAGVAAAG